MTTSHQVEPHSDDQACPYHAAFTANRMADITALLRSDAVVNSPEVNVGVFGGSDPLGDLNLREFVSGILPFVDGEDHRTRRKVLNALVRPKSLEVLREDVVLPAVRRQVEFALTQPDEDGTYSCDLAALVERVFLEFSARLIGFQGLDTQEAISDLRTCVLPLFAGLTSLHFEDRAAVLERAMAAKAHYVEAYYQPALAYHQQLWARAEAGEIGQDELPMNLMRMIVSHAHPAYEDEEQAIRESMLFFIAATGTSTQAVLSTVHYLSQWFEDHPEDYHLRTDLGFLSIALQESLRLRAPYISYLSRLATADIEVNGQQIHTNQELHLQVPAAGRDREVYGDDADRFNPHRSVPAGVAHYGVGFAAGPHACLGLRVVLGNDGRGGSHIRLLQGLFEAGVQIDHLSAPEILEMRETQDSVADIPTYRTFPVRFTNWDPAVAFGARTV